MGCCQSRTDHDIDEIRPLIGPETDAYHKKTTVVCPYVSSERELSSIVNHAANKMINVNDNNKALLDDMLPVDMKQKHMKYQQLIKTINPYTPYIPTSIYSSTSSVYTNLNEASPFGGLSSPTMTWFNQAIADIHSSHHTLLNSKQFYRHDPIIVHLKYPSLPTLSNKRRRSSQARI